MSFMNQMKMAQDMMKNMSPEELKQMMEQAKEQQGAVQDQVAQMVAEEIKKQGLVTRAEVEDMISESKA